jgi:uncharacterized membrane protein
MILPAGFEAPPLAYVVFLVVALASVLARLVVESPRVTERTALALAPWMAAGAGGYVCYQIDAVPPVLAPLASSPVVYLTTFVVAGTVWLLAARVRADPAPHLAAAGVLAWLLPTGVAVWVGAHRGTLQVVWPLAAVTVTTALTALVWAGLRRLRPEPTDLTRGAGAFVVFGHALDGVSTAVGVDVLGFGEQTPLSRLILELGNALPTAPYVGGAWLFVAVKLALACAVVLLLADQVREAPASGYLLLAAVAAVGFGPGVHNLLLFVVAS